MILKELKLDDNWEIICPWAQIIVGTTMPAEVTENMIELTDEISAELRYPPFNAFIKNYGTDQTETEFSYMIINNCIDAVINGETRISADEVSLKDIKEFVESMNSKQFQSVADYIQSMPTLEQKVEFKCTNCEHENNRTLRGISDFFS
mgnify:CR=1 FL=1